MCALLVLRYMCIKPWIQNFLCCVLIINCTGFKTISVNQWNVARFLRCKQGGQAHSLDRGNSGPKKKIWSLFVFSIEKDYNKIATMAINMLWNGKSRLFPSEPMHAITDTQLMIVMERSYWCKSLADDWLK